MYDPVVGRFVTADSIIQNYFDPQMLNRYSYVRNNPLVYTDPTGHVLDIAIQQSIAAQQIMANQMAASAGSNQYIQQNSNEAIASGLTKALRSFDPRVQVLKWLNSLVYLHDLTDDEIEEERSGNASPEDTDDQDPKKTKYKKGQKQTPNPPKDKKKDSRSKRVDNANDQATEIMNQQDLNKKRGRPYDIESTKKSEQNESTDWRRGKYE